MSKSESEEVNRVPSKCTASHDGRLMLDEIYSLHVDQLFTMLFTNSQFFVDLQDLRKAYNVVASAWSDETDGTKKRIITMTIPLAHTMGPKSSNVKETQIMLSCSEPGLLYSIDVTIENSGIPYADRFYLTAHYCLVKCTDQKTSLEVYTNVKYRQKVWGFVKHFIDKNSWQGLEEVYIKLNIELHNVIEETANISHKRRIRKRKRPSNANRRPEEIKIRTGNSPHLMLENFQIDVSLLIIFALLLLVIINIYLFYKLSLLEQLFSFEVTDSSEIRNKIIIAHENFIRTLRENQVISNVESDKWYAALTTTMRYLKNAEESLHLVISTTANEPQELE